MTAIDTKGFDALVAQFPSRPRVEVDMRNAKRYVKIEWIDDVPVCWTGDTVAEVEGKAHAIPCWAEPAGFMAL